MSKPVAVGIDLGSTHSCVGVFDDGHVTILTDPLTQSTTVPSWVCFTEEGHFIGEKARHQATNNPLNTMYNIKRIIGRNYDDFEIQQDLKNFPFQTSADDNNRILIHTQVSGDKKSYYPEEISAYVLSYLKDMAETYLNKKVDEVVITVPAYFTDSQRTATKKAALLAGFAKVSRIINEPTAAAFAYGLTSSSSKEECILVMDIGGCTSDISILSIDDGFFEVKGTSGLTHLGGEDFNQAIADYVRNRCIFDDLTPEGEMKFKHIIEKAKKELSTSEKVTIDLTDLGQEITTFNLTREAFINKAGHLLHRCLELVDQALNEARLSKSDIDRLVMVGGSTRIPYLKEYLSKMFGGKEITKNINPDEAIAYGATVQAALLAGVDDSVLNNMVITDVTSLSIGVEVVGGIFRRIVSKNTIIPCKRSHQFSTFYDDQPAVSVNIFEGERALVKDNHLLGKFLLEGIKRAPKGKAKIIVNFEIDVDGILTVTARDEEEGTSYSITIQYGNEKNKNVKQSIDDAIKNLDADEKETERIKQRLRNLFEAETISQQIKILPMEVQEEFKDDIQEHQEWLRDNPDASYEEIKEHEKEMKGLLENILDRNNRQ
jgi:molecular chaperone DnaK (HSP70)